MILETTNLSVSAAKKAAAEESRSKFIASIREANTKLAHQLKRADIQVAPDKNRQPLDTFRNAGIPFEAETRKDRAEIVRWCRNFYATDSVIPLLIDIYSRFPIAGWHLQCKDPQITQFYSEMFETLDYDLFLVDLGREFFQVGEFSALGHWNETMGIWQNDELLNPDDVYVEQNIFGGNSYKIAIPPSIVQICQTQTPRNQYETLRKNFPDIVSMAEQQAQRSSVFATDDEFFGVEVSDVLLSRDINKVQPWDLYGTPHMVRTFPYLMLQESLMAAQAAVSDRLYSPFILAKLGSPNDLGDGQGPWIPNPEEIGAFTEMMQAALMSDFRLLAYHFGVDISSVFGRESVPRFDQDFQRIENKILQVWGIGSAMINGGSSQQTYASSSVNLDVATQLMSSFQRIVRKHLRKRMEVVAEAQGHFDYRVSGNLRVPIYEEVLVYDQDTGEERIVKRPKLLIPDVEFPSITLRDQNVERQWLKTLKDNGIPIADETLLVQVDIDFDEQLEKQKKEAVKKIVHEAEVMEQAYKALKSKGLPIPEKLKPVEESMMPEERIIGDDDTTITTPNVAPTEDDISSDTESTESDEEPEIKELPKNWLRSRPEVSDERRKDMPRAAWVKTAQTYDQDEITHHRPTHSLERGPSTWGLSAKLTAESIKSRLNPTKDSS